MMAEKKLSPFEIAVIEHILKNERPELVAHLSLIEVEKRENTGVGLYTNFNYLEEPPIKLHTNSTLGKSVYAEIEGLENGAGFMLYIDEGKITMLECFSHTSETWPDYISKFHIKNL